MDVISSAETLVNVYGLHGTVPYKTALRHENLKSYTIKLQGEGTLRNFRRFEALRVKLAKQHCSVSIPLRCREKARSPASYSSP